MKILGTQRIQTTSYHPIANGLVEQFHRAFWASISQDLKCTPAELVYGTTLHLPGEFFDSDPSSDISDPTLYAKFLKTFMQQIWPTPMRQHRFVLWGMMG